MVRPKARVVMIGCLCWCVGVWLVGSGCMVYTRPAPPPRRVEVITTRPHAKAVWVAGHWKWSRWKRRHVWVPGHWVVRKRGRNRKVIIVR